MSDDQAKAEELLQGQTEQARHQTDPSIDDTDDTPALEDAIADAFERIDAGDLSSNLTLRDKRLAALFHGLEDADDLAAVGEKAAAELDSDADDKETRAAVLRLLVRIGLETVDPSVLESGKAGRRQYLEDDEF